MANPPARPGWYECAVRLCGLQRGLIVWGLLEWDGVGFRVPVPMVVKLWRGLRARPQEDNMSAVVSENTNGVQGKMR